MMPCEVELEIKITHIPEFLELMENVKAGLARIESDSMDASAKFWAARTIKRIEGFCGED